MGWNKKDKHKRAPNVLEMIERFNYVSGWVATTICTTESVKKRSKVISKFIEVAEVCFTLFFFPFFLLFTDSLFCTLLAFIALRKSERCDGNRIRIE